MKMTHLSTAVFLSVALCGLPAIAETAEVDELVRLNGKWLIKVRDVAPKE